MGFQAKSAGFQSKALGWRAKASAWSAKSTGFGAKITNENAGVSRDGPNNWYVPASAADFALLGITAPNSLWLCQEAAGNLADSIGALALVAAGGPTYQQTEVGWTRKAVQLANNAADAFAVGAGVGPNPSNTSSLWIAYVDVTATPASARSIMTAGGAIAASEVDVRVGVGGTALPNVKCMAVLAAGVVDIVAPNVVLVALMYNRAAGTVVGYTDSEKIPGTYNAGVTDGVKGFGAARVTSAPMRVLWAAMWSGANAELSDAQVKARLQALGITIPW